MSTFRRTISPGATYFFTLVSEGRRPILIDPRVITAIRAAIRNLQVAMPFRPIAMVVLPDHLHCLWSLPEHDADYSRRWSIVKRIVAQTCRHLAPSARGGCQEKRREIGLWQRRFWEHQIRNPEDLHRHIEYIHFNPVRHGLVERAADWPHSSIHRFVRRGFVPPDWGIGERVIEGRFGEPR